MLGKEFTVLEDLEEHLPRPVKVPCKFSNILDSLSDSDREILEGALAEKHKWSTHALYIALRQKGIDVGYQTIYRHRKNTCACLAVNA
jgi:hypothetical protein